MNISEIQQLIVDSLNICSNHSIFLQRPTLSKGKGVHRDPFVWYDPGKGMMMMMKYAYKQKYYGSNKSSKKMKSSLKKSSKKGKKSSKYSYPVYYKGATPTYYKGKGFTGGTPYYGKTDGTFSKTMGKGMSKKHSVYGGRIYQNAAGARGSPFNYNDPQPQQLPSSYFFYRGNGKGNRGIDVFVFGRPN